jgi:hypothetical protein
MLPAIPSGPAAAGFMVILLRIAYFIHAFLWLLL